VRIVFEEHGFPRELTTPSDFARAVQDGSVRPDTRVTVYRDATAPAVVPASAVDELRPHLGLFDSTPAPQIATAPSTTQPVITSTTDGRTASVPPAPAAQSAAPVAPGQRYNKDFAPVPVTADRGGTPIRADERPARITDTVGSGAADRAPRHPASSSTSTTALPFVPLVKYADFSGRASRAEYWQFTGMAVLAIILGVGMSETFGILVLLALALPSLAVSVRRLHDANITGWAVLVGIIPYAGGIIMLVMLLLAGTPKPNRYGEVPRGAPVPIG
jgi:uncharacterized membrane protein YhaH (DUF805 family)